MKPYYDHGGIAIYHGDCREIIPSLGEWTGLVMTDPPYGTGGWRRSTAGAGSNPAASLVREEWDDGAVDWLRLVPRAEAIISFWPSSSAWRFLAAAYESGFTKHRGLYMRKRDPKPQVAGRVRWSVEPIWVVSRDGFLLFGETDLIDATTPRVGRDSEATGHPYQKPLRVMRWLVDLTLPRPIIDPFMGSGTTLRAAKDAGRVAVGIDEDERNCEIAASRMSQEGLFGMTRDVDGTLSA